jgi:hypothetical protein
MWNSVAAAFHTHYVIIAASEGAIAALSINTALLSEGNG